MATSMMKQRLIGAAVLIALGVIFIPMLLTGDGKFFSGDMESSVPEKPMYELKAPKVLDLDKRTEQASEPVGEPAITAQQPESEKTASTAPKEETKLDVKPESIVQEPVAPEPVPSEPTKPQAAKADVEKKTPEKKPAVANTDKKTQAKKVEPTPPPVETKKEKPIVSGWVVQLGSFSVQKNALNLRDKLRKNGHASFVEEFKRNGKTSYRVRVGPELNRELAIELKKKLKAETKIDGFVIEFPGK